MLECEIRLKLKVKVFCCEERTIPLCSMFIYARSHQPDLLIATAIRAGTQFGEITTTLRSATCAATFAGARSRPRGSLYPPTRHGLPDAGLLLVCFTRVVDRLNSGSEFWLSRW